VLGESGTKPFLFNAESGLYAEEPEELHRHLYSIFNEGALILEKTIVKELFLRLNIQYDITDSFEFATHIKQAKKFFIESRKSHCCK